ncbi:MAG TPA: alkaline phosphatase [Clostridia bacterium]|nr:alkaline phosphatase [Clostridia bacterium]
MLKKAKKILCAALVLCMILSMFIGVSAEPEKTSKVKNVILFITDGTSLTHVTAARWYQGGQALALDETLCGLVRTYGSDSLITDSAPAATAMATGFKSHTGFISVLPDVSNMPLLDPVAPGDARKPVATVLEGARLEGKATGLVTTCEIMHATPAAFSSHDESRKDYDDIGEQQVYQEMEVVLSGGSKFMTAEVRKDKEDMVAALKGMGYSYITTKDEMEAQKSGKVWGLFAEADIAYDFDRDALKVPSLSEMTGKAIDLLSEDKDGFFLMVEGSKVDWASHANEPVGVISEVLSFDKAVKVALDFAKENKDTLVIITADHGNGGMSIGSAATNKGYDETPYAAVFDPLKKAKLTEVGAEKMLDADKTNIVEVAQKYLGIDDLTEEEIAAIKAAKVPAEAFGLAMSKRSKIGWTTTGHEGEDVILGIYTPDNKERLTGLVQNTDLAGYMAASMGFDMEELNKALIVNAAKAFEAKGAKVVLNKDLAPNLELTVTKGNDKLIFYVNKNVVLHNGVIKKMPGVAIHNGIDFYVPQYGIDIIK